MINFLLYYPMIKRMSISIQQRGRPDTLFASTTIGTTLRAIVGRGYEG
jgi:hypothetical protein